MKKDENAKEKQGRSSQKKPSYKELARLAKVSPATVSRIVRGHLNVDPDLRTRVREAAGVLGIDLDQKRNEKANIVAFLLANRDLLHTFQARILSGAEVYCASHHRELLFMSFHYSPAVPARELHLPRILGEPGIVRAVILGGTNSPNMLTALREREIPFTVLGNNVMGEWNSKDFDAVYSDDIQGAYDLTTHLIAGGHREIWFIGDVDLPWYARCARGYRECMAAAGLRPRLSRIHTDDRQQGYLAMRSILSKGEPITAVFAGSDQIARGVYEAVQQAGLRIPDDISIAGFNDTEGDLMFPPLTSVREFPETLGKHMAESVLKRIQHPERPALQITIPTQLVIRQSTRAISGQKASDIVHAGAAEI
ncbi:MAG: LacI family DNA-binding transcriptional regulator [Blastocatellia bacterium]|nr:LacI family DNA-binding transcriptional regulator [Blastocatellia bacterium]